MNAGDYILVWGDVDEDGFYDGEILDGRRGLVPSNFVEKLEGDDLVDFHQQVVLGVGDCDDSVCTSIPQDLDFLSSDEVRHVHSATHIRAQIWSPKFLPAALAEAGLEIAFQVGPSGMDCWRGR